MHRKGIDPEALAERLELPAEALGALLVTAIGQHRLLIENHRGIALYSDVCLRLRAAGGCFAVYGEALRIRARSALTARLRRAGVRAWAIGNRGCAPSFTIAHCLIPDPSSVFARKP